MRSGGAGVWGGKLTWRKQIKRKTLPIKAQQARDDFSYIKLCMCNFKKYFIYLSDKERVQQGEQQAEAGGDAPLSREPGMGREPRTLRS